MRRSGFVESARGLDHGHLGCAFDDRHRWHTMAADFMRDGLAENQLVEYVAAGSAEMVQEELEQILAILGRHASDGGAVSTPLYSFSRFQAGSDLIDPEASTALRVAAAEQALADGYSGHRTIVEATALAGTPSRRDALARFEHLIDERMSFLPISGICGYDSAALGHEACSELICLHPLVVEGDASFRLHPAEDAELALSGEIDLACEREFAVALERSLALTGGAEAVIDGSDLGYLDHRGLDILDRTAAEHGLTIRLINAPPVVTRLVQLMGPRAIELGPGRRGGGLSPF